MVMRTIRNEEYTIKITLQNEDYKGHIGYEIGSRYLRFTIINSFSLEEIDENDVRGFTINDCNFQVDDESELFDVILTNEQGKSLVLENLELGYIENMVVAIEIIDCKEEAKYEKVYER